jgi:hypothetical protein
MSKAVAKTSAAGPVVVAADGTAHASVDLDSLNLGGTVDFATVARALHEAGLLENSDEWSDGTLVDDKRKLIGVTFLITSVDVRVSDKYIRKNDDGSEAGEPYVFVSAITKDNVRVKFTGGGSLAVQVLELMAKRDGKPFGGLVVRNGLRPSSYMVEDASGNKTEATSWYLDI